jgi:hypothetical protein
VWAVRRRDAAAGSALKHTPPLWRLCATAGGRDAAGVSRPQARGPGSLLCFAERVTEGCIFGQELQQIRGVRLK